MASKAEDIIEVFNKELLVQVVQGHEIYLGLPTFSMRSKRMQIGYLKERILKRIPGWGGKVFSEGGKEVLIKAVLQAITTYAMPCFKILVCNEIESACSNFWWGVEGGRKKLHWNKWNDLCRPKCMG
ncbi:hypothetical protein DH2020_004134 [Rehmannia glutinosa]|uniref:Uncharacterized protein n=1 Tax=Rehmannia glutinosa TaxID=99300 RepID=A0ABR0XNX2_REHGL